MIWVFDDIAETSIVGGHDSDDGLVANFKAPGEGRVAIAVINTEWCLWRKGEIVLRDPAFEAVYRQATAFYALTGHGTSRISIEWDEQQYRRRRQR